MYSRYKRLCIRAYRFGFCHFHYALINNRICNDLTSGISGITIVSSYIEHAVVRAHIILCTL